MIKILIVEDEESIFNLLKISVNQAGFSCIQASDGVRSLGPSKPN